MFEWAKRWLAITLKQFLKISKNTGSTTQYSVMVYIRKELLKKKKKTVFNPDLPGSSVIKTLPANAGDWG